MPHFHVGGAIIMNLRALIMGQTLLILTPGGCLLRTVTLDSTPAVMPEKAAFFQS
jgi:hypothetical protein